MHTFIGMEDLVANALIELLEKDNCRKVSFAALVKYGNVVLRFLHENGEEAVFLLSKGYTNELIRNYSDFFEIDYSEPGKEAIALKKEKTADDLRNRFRALLTMELLFAFIDEKSVSELRRAAL